MHIFDTSFTVFDVIIVVMSAIVTPIHLLIATSRSQYLKRLLIATSYSQWLKWKMKDGEIYHHHHHYHHQSVINKFMNKSVTCRLYLTTVISCLVIF